MKKFISKKAPILILWSATVIFIYIGAVNAVGIVARHAEYGQEYETNWFAGAGLILGAFALVLSILHIINNRWGE